MDRGAKIQKSDVFVCVLPYPMNPSGVQSERALPVGFKRRSFGALLVDESREGIHPFRDLSMRDISRSAGQYGLMLNHYTTGGKADVRKMSNLWTKRALAGSTYSRLLVAGLALVAALESSARAQNDRMTPIATPSQPNAIELGTGPLPGATNSETWHRQYGSQFARNVTGSTRPWPATARRWSSTRRTS